MNEQEQQPTASDSHSAGEALYVYCIAETVAARKIAAETTPSAIEDDNDLELLDIGEVAAVTSKVPLSMYGEESLNQNLNDPSWTALRAMRHERVVEHFAKRTSVVPLRFGTIYLSRDGVKQMLSDKRLELREILDRVRDCEEWGVNLFSDRDKLLEAITDLSPRLRDLSEQAQTASPGQAYLLQKKVQGLRSDEARAELARIIDDVEAKLGKKTKGTKRLRVLKVEATESGELKAKFAFLVDRSRFDDFRREAERIAENVNKAGIRLELTGPWPAYNFTAAA
jgi:Gas vesicle synthesis protein GvpL/GvpF